MQTQQVPSPLTTSLPAPASWVPLGRVHLAVGPARLRRGQVGSRLAFGIFICPGYPPFLGGCLAPE